MKAETRWMQAESVMEAIKAKLVERYRIRNAHIDFKDNVTRITMDEDYKSIYGEWKRGYWVEISNDDLLDFYNGIAVPRTDCSEPLT